jgi:hypothetical protein
MEDNKLAGLLKGSQKPQGMTGEEALELERVLSIINGIDLDKAIEQKQAQMLPMDRALARLNNGGQLVRRAKAKKAKRKKLHWRTKEARKRAENQQYYVRRGKDNRRKALAEKLTSAEGWWEHVSGSWKRKGLKVEVTGEEWKEAVWPVVEGRLFITYRYNCKEPMSLKNMIVKDTEDGAVLFDGKEHELKKLGYCL